MVGRRVAEERTRRGISQRAMAREMGISAPRLSQLESGEAWTVATLCDAARVIGVQPSELMREQEALRDEERRVIDLLRSGNLPASMIALGEAAIRRGG